MFFLFISSHCTLSLLSSVNGSVSHSFLPSFSSFPFLLLSSFRCLCLFFFPIIKLSLPSLFSLWLSIASVTHHPLPFSSFFPSQIFIVFLFFLSYHQILSSFPSVFSLAFNQRLSSLPSVFSIAFNHSYFYFQSITSFVPLSQAFPSPHLYLSLPLQSLLILPLSSLPPLCQSVPLFPPFTWPSLTYLLLHITYFYLLLFVCLFL